MCKITRNFGSLDTKNKEISCDSRLLHATAYVQSMVHVQRRKSFLSLVLQLKTFHWRLLDLTDPAM